MTQIGRRIGEVLPTDAGDTLVDVLRVHRATRADILADGLARLLAQSLDDPFAPELVAVPTRGMERWLAQRMSATLGASPDRADGVCANVLFPTPHRLVTDAVAAASDVDPDDDPWLPERSTWPLLAVVDECLTEPWLASLAVYLGAGDAPPDPVRHARRLSVVRHLAGLYDRYAMHRPLMLEAWAVGADHDAAGTPLPAGAEWQAELWRRLRARIGVPGPAERRDRARARLVADPGVVGLPARLALFGLTRLPAGQLQILRALASGRDVHLFLLHPSPSLWEAVARERSRDDAPVRRRATDPTAGLAANRLLASWGRDAREMQLVLESASEPAADHDHASKPTDDHDHASKPTDDHDHEPTDAPARATLLSRLQADVRGDRPAPGAPRAGGADERPGLDPADRSLQIHSCHGRQRQVEVLHDAILHALDEDPTLEPRDVIVMCPEIEAFAPLIQASFGAGEIPADAAADDGRDAEPPPAAPAIDLRVRLADRALNQTNPVLSVVSELLGLVGERVTASQVLDLADRAPVRRRFQFDDDDLARMQDWIAQSGIRWGLDGPHRAAYKLGAIDSGTWRTGLDRLLLGVTMNEDGQRLFGGVLPLDDVDSRSIELAGRLCELVARVGDALDSLGRSQPLPDWADTIARATDALTDTVGRDRWQRAELQRILDEMVAEAGDGGAARQLACAEIRAHLGSRLEGRPTRANFRTGHLTVCTLHPMRSVPHRIVCLLGLDDGAFPRKAPRDGDDLMLDDPQVGERDPRSEDRQLLLDALLAATERLIVTFTGNDERTNTPRPPAVPIGELLDVVDATVRCADDPARPAHEQVLVHHPLQPFHPVNFTAGALGGPRPWSFDPVALEGADALAGPRRAPRAFLTAPLEPHGDRVIELDDLVRFVEHPVRAFLRQRLGISLRSAGDEIEDRLAVELDDLGRWSVGQRLLQARLRGAEGRTAILAEIARGSLPPGVLGEPVIHEVYPVVDAIATQVAGLLGDGSGGRAGRVDVRVALPDGRLLSGTVAGVNGELLLTTTYSRVAAKHRLAAWVRLLGLTATRPERALTAATVGRAGGGDDVRVAEVTIAAGDAEAREAAARGQLLALVDLYDRGMREPLPLFCRTSAAYAQAAAAGQDPVDAARREWETEWRFEREDREPEHQLVLGGVLTFAELMAPAPGPDEAGDGWATDDDSRLGRYALRLWEGLLERERVSAR